MSKRSRLASIMKGEIPDNFTYCEITGTIWDNENVMIPKWNPKEKRSYILLGGFRLWIDDFNKAIATISEVIENETNH